MPQVTVYVREDDIDDWKKLKDKSEKVHRMLSWERGVEAREHLFSDTTVRLSIRVDDLLTKAHATYTHSAVPLESIEMTDAIIQKLLIGIRRRVFASAEESRNE